MARYRELTALWMAARERAGGKLTQAEEARWAGDVDRVWVGLGWGTARCIPGAVADGDDDPELVALRALNARIEVLHALRWGADGREDPAVVIALDALDTEAAALIRARCDRTLAPIVRRTNAALVVAHHLLGMPPLRGVAIGYEEALEYLRSLETMAFASGVGFGATRRRPDRPRPGAPDGVSGP